MNLAVNNVECERPRALLSLREATVLADVSEKSVRKDIERGVLSPVHRLSDSRMCFSWGYVFTFAAVYSNALMTSALRKSAIEKINTLGLFTLVDEQISHDVLYQHGFRWYTRAKLNIDKYIDIDLELACKDVKPRVSLYAWGLSRIEEKPGVLGGDAVFKGTRVPVHHVAMMLERGESPKNILEDFPSLKDEDLRFAKIYALAHPIVGRPRAGDEADNVSHDAG